jgi:Phage gp6-like head-tail connector protein
MSDPLPPEIPNVRLPAPPSPASAFEPGAYQDRDNFVRDLVTKLAAWGWWPWWSGGSSPTPPITPTPSAVGRAPVLTLAQCKMHLRIELSQTIEDDYVTNLEMAARLHAENFLRYQIDASVGENIKQALLFLIAHFYRNREAVTLGTLMKSDPTVLAFEALLYPERDFPTY